MNDGVTRSLRRLRAGAPVVVYDQDRDEGDLVAGAASISSDTVNTMVTLGRGLLSVVVTQARCEALNLRPMPTQRAGGRELCERTPTMLSVESRYGVSSGISAHDRATTIGVVADPATQPADLVNPGHVFPLVAPDRGTRERSGRLGAAIDMLRLAGMPPVAAICDVLDEDGQLAGVRHLRTAADALLVPVVSIEDVERAFEEDLAHRPSRPRSQRLRVIAGEVGG